VRPFAGRDRVVRIDAGVWPAARVDTDPISCAERDAFPAQQEAGTLHHALQLRELKSDGRYVNEKIISLIVPTDQLAKIAAALLQPVGPPITEQAMIDGNTLQ
jgi:hypothetical protein